MDLLTPTQSSVTEKTEELCRTIVDQPGFEKMQADLKAFEGNAEAQRLYNDVLNLQDELQKKQQSGTPLSNDDIRRFETERDKLLNNDISRGFLDAQKQIQNVQQLVMQYVTKTFELGRVPEDADLNTGGCCGGGCSCGSGGSGCGSC